MSAPHQFVGRRQKVTVGLLFPVDGLPTEQAWTKPRAERRRNEHAEQVPDTDKWRRELGAM